MKTILLAYEERPVCAADRRAHRGAGKRLLREGARHERRPGAATSGQGPWDPADPPSRHRKEVDHAVARLTELGVTDVQAVVTTGDPSHAIVELADERKADLIVLGAHEGGLVSRVIEGSVGDAVAHAAHTDVLIVH